LHQHNERACLVYLKLLAEQRIPVSLPET
jgi:hypothetical protein